MCTQTVLPLVTQTVPAVCGQNVPPRERLAGRRQNRRLWNLTIGEFAGYVANEGSVKFCTDETPPLWAGPRRRGGGVGIVPSANQGAKSAGPRAALEPLAH